MTAVRMLLAALAIVATSTCQAAIYGNDSAANARPILADGTTYTDGMTPASTDAWFAFRVDPYQSYSVEVWSPFGKIQDTDNAVGIWALLESDGVSSILTSDRSFDFPSPQVDVGFTQGERRTFVNMGGARRLLVRVVKTGGAPTVGHNFAIRIVPTTLVATRWSVNGYNDVLGLTNAGAANDFTGAIAGSILYFNEAGGLVGSELHARGERQRAVHEDERRGDRRRHAWRHPRRARRRARRGARAAELVQPGDRPVRRVPVHAPRARVQPRRTLSAVTAPRSPRVQPSPGSGARGIPPTRAGRR